jgi:azurin/HEAT repeat protein
LNPHGRVFDYWGNDLITDATGNDNYFGPAMSGHLDTGAHPALKTFWGQPSRPCAGTAILSSRHFPDDWQGNFLNANVLGMQGVFRAELHGQGSGIAGRTLEHLVSADLEKNPYFRPAGITVAPDGSLYLMDWSQYLIGHLQHHLRDPHRDHAHGRLYRITYEGRPLLVPKKIDGQPIASLLPLLKEPEDDVRLRVKMELAKHDAKEVAAATVAWVATLDPKDSALEHHLLEALWVHQWNNVVNLELLARVLKSSEPRARAQAVRVIGYWRDRVPRALAMVKAAADDPAPRVRLEAVRVASFFREIAAADAALTVLKQPMDEYLSYTFAQTMKQLQPWWKDAIREGKELAVGNPAGINFLLDSVPSADLANLPKTATIYAAILNRPDVTKAARTAALTELSKLKQSSSPTDTLLGILKAAPITENQGTTDLCALLLMQSATSLKSARKTLLELSLTAASATVRQNACAALITADGSLEPVIEAVKWDPKALLNFVTVLPLVKDAALRSTGYTFAKNLLSTPTKETRTLKARYIRISLPRVGILSLAEVQVFSGGNNIALASKATQQSTGYGFGADRANDGDTNGNISVNSITHTAEGSDHPWWELDLGSEHPVENITIWNRTDGSFNTRLEGFELTALDATRQQVFTQSGNPFPSEAVKIHLQDQTEQQIRRAAIQALAHLGKDPVAAFDTLASLIKKNDEVATAAQSMAIIPITSWPKEQAGATAKGIFEWARTIPVASRTTAEYTATLQVAHQLVSLLPPHQVASATKAIRSLTVPIHTIKCVREQLRYDTTRFVVEAGKPYQILFENPDAMPHNLVIVMPGTLQEVAAAAQIQPPDKLDSSGRAYVLAGDSRIVEATKLVLPGKSETLNLTAPTVEGTYPYACTFPGHWSVMKGEMIITKDVEAYLAAHPEK